MANGLLKSPKQENDKCGGRIDLQYFKDLWSKGFVQDVMDYILYYWFKVHDLIHDLALNVSQEECLIIYQQTVSASDNVRHLTFADHNPLRTPQSFLKKLKGMLTLKFLPQMKELRVIEKSFLTS
ncbi:hypothetical protein Golax_015053 [Gossypium laxum]|uniref:Disease resistance protein winged helix domain-containing protein n=1 Tax=Gossypium laxum TaxID=34288 RepID=A0A7J8ZWM1_9ROSI|nr:hypothetical protein [Gossypium laxum]